MFLFFISRCISRLPRHLSPYIFICTAQVLNLIQSYVTLRVPLYVSYMFHSPVGAGGWQHFDLQSELRLTFVYDTAILWRDGIGSPPEADLQGRGLRIGFQNMRKKIFHPHSQDGDDFCHWLFL